MMQSKRVWSTDQVASHHRLDYWVGAVCEAFLEMHVTSSRKDRFRAHLEAARLDLLTLNGVSATAQHVYRRHVDISRSGQNYYYLLYNHGSPWTVQQMGGGGRLLTGDMTLVDSRERYEFNFPDDFSVLSVQGR